MRRLSFSILNKVIEDSDRMLPDALGHIIIAGRPFPEISWKLQSFGCQSQTNPSVVFSQQPVELC